MMQAHNILYVTASAQNESSVTRRFANELIEQLQSEYPQVRVHTRDVAQGLPFINQDWVSANFTPAEQRTDEQRTILSESDRLVEQIVEADSLVIATPMYNFNVPASLKAWIDLVARVGLTFQYTAEGPVGLLKGKKAYLVMASGGTQFGSDIDFSTGYLKHVLGFMGIQDVELISAERFNPQDSQAITDIQTRITQLAQQVDWQAA
jgi:FMN-dependent NADH-azoreductase